MTKNATYFKKLLALISSILNCIVLCCILFYCCIQFKCCHNCLCCRELFVTFARLGSAMGDDAWRAMLAPVPFRMLSVQSVSEEFGIMGGAFSAAPSAPPASVKMTNLSIKHPVKFWNLKTTSVSCYLDQLSLEDH